MPYKITKQGGKFCVAKQDTGEAIKGGCHSSRADAVDQLQALYANEAMAAIAESFTLSDIEEDVNVLVASFTLTERNWKGPIAFENVATGDKRQFSSEAITFDKLPIPLLFQRTSGEGHSGSVVIGRVDDIQRNGDTLSANGVILEGIPEADEFLALMEHGAAGGVSVDGDSAQYQVEEVEEGGQKKVQFTSMRIRGLTAVAIPAFADAQIELTDETPEVEAETELNISDEAADAASDLEIEELAKKRRKAGVDAGRSAMWKYAREAGIIASAAPVKPPLEWFMNPLLSGPTPLTITEDGAVFGHIALKGVCHIGMPGCTKVPTGGSYNYFHTGELITDDGTPVAVGHLTFNTGHADVFSNAANAAAHYDNTGAVGADVIAGEDKFGVWVAGALRPELTDEQIRTFRAAPISGDWRRIGSKMELVAALSVNTPGFPVPRTRALVASGALQPETLITVSEEEQIMDQNERMEFRTFLADKVRTVFADSPCKTEGAAGCFPASDYAYVPDPQAQSTWKLRLTATPGGDPDSGIVGAAVAALFKGFRGNVVQIPAADKAKVIAKVAAAWRKANPDKKDSEMPAELHSAITAHGGMMDAIYGGQDGPDSQSFDGDDDALEALLEHHDEILDLIDGYTADDPDVQAYLDKTEIAVKESSAAAYNLLAKLIVQPDTDASQGDNVPADTTYSAADVQFGSLPPALAAGIVKKLKAQLDKETDPDKKAAIQAKIDKFSPSSKAADKTAMSDDDTVELTADTEEFAASYSIKSQFGKFCVKDPKGMIVKGGCYKTEDEAKAKLASLNA